VDRITAWILTGIVSTYGIFYLVHALTPEIQPDALYYHLGQVAEYSRLGKFPAHIDFYSVLPQGMEIGVTCLPSRLASSPPPSRILARAIA